MKPYIFIISGKAKVGKDTTANFIKEYCKNKGLNAINLQYSSYIKMYVKEISNWDGLEENKPRVLLQDLGDIIRHDINEYFFINRIYEDILIYSKYFNVITISDARLPLELDKIKEYFPTAIKLNIKRPYFNPYKSLEEQNHPTELALDNYHNFDYIIINDQTLNILNQKVIDILNNIIK